MHRLLSGPSSKLKAKQWLEAPQTLYPRSTNFNKIIVRLNFKILIELLIKVSSVRLSPLKNGKKRLLLDAGMKLQYCLAQILIYPW